MLAVPLQVLPYEDRIHLRPNAVPKQNLMDPEHTYTREETHMEPENHWVVEENCLPKVHFQVPC